MSKKKEDRYRSVLEFTNDIDDLLRGKMEFETVAFEKDRFLVKEGQQGTNCYIITSGKAEVYKTVGGDKISLGTVERGDIVGEMALITDEPRMATAIALEYTEAIVLNKEIFTHNLNRLPSWMERSIMALANRLRIANTRYSDTIAISKSAIKKV